MEAWLRALRHLCDWASQLAQFRDLEVHSLLVLVKQV